MGTYELERLYLDYEEALDEAQPVALRHLASYLARCFAEVPYPDGLERELGELLTTVDGYFHQIFNYFPAATVREKELYHGKLAKGAGYLYLWRLFEGYPQEADKYVDLMREFYPSDGITQFDLDVKAAQVAQLIEERDLDRARVIYEDPDFNNVPKKYYLTRYTTLSYLFYISVFNKMPKKAIAYYNDLWKLSDEIWRMKKWRESGAISLARRSEAAEAPPKVPSGGSGANIFNFTPKISLVAPSETRVAREPETPDPANLDEYVYVDSQDANLLIPKTDNYFENPSFFDAIFIDTLIRQFEVLVSLTSVLCATGKGLYANYCYGTLIARGGETGARTALEIGSVEIAEIHARGVSLKTLPIAEDFFEECLSFVTEGGAESLENQAMILLLYHYLYAELTESGKLSPRFGQKAQKIYARLVGLDIANEAAISYKSQAANQMLAIIANLDLGLDFAREVLDYVCSFEDDWELNRVKLSCYHTIINYALNNYSVEEALFLYWKSSALSGRSPEFLELRADIVCQFVLYYLLEDTFDERKAVEYFSMVEIDADSSRALVGLWLEHANLVFYGLRDRYLFKEAREFLDAQAKYASIKPVKKRLATLRAKLKRARRERYG
ncbi:MAG: hypothetical protein LBO66_02310 [Deltaproteobacteria bacterium]|jgi:hypothetical protein|nr:hypothetical protein [Deltaproteobacteria bacterium]